jgi:hypothetical protein
MAFLEAFEKSFGMIVKNLKVVLPATLRWLITSLYVFYLLFFWRFFDNHTGLMERIKMFLLYEDKGALGSFGNFKLFLENYSSYIFAFLLGLFLISAIYLGLDIFLDLFYTSSMKQYHSRKKVDFNQSLVASWKFFWKLFYTWMLAFMAILLSIVATIFLIFIPILGVFAFFAFLFLILFFALILFMLPSIVAFEKKSGIEALKGATNFVKGNFFSLFGVLIIFAVLQFVALFSISSIPLIGYFAYLIIDMFFICWSKSLPAAFYLEVKSQKRF